MIYSVVKIQVKELTFSWFGINPFTHLDKGGQNAHPKSPLFQKFLENIFLETKKPPFSLLPAKKTAGRNFHNSDV
ncbi:hypothetical protein C9377_07965 [Streptococcus suis]|nr:hypothetical protein C9377_07965 [Streptococcus suis]